MKTSLLALLMGARDECVHVRQTPAAAVELQHFRLDSLEGVRATTGASFDTKRLHGRQRFPRIDAKGPMTVPVFEVTGVDIETRDPDLPGASLQSENLDERLSWKMWVRHSRKGQ